MSATQTWPRPEGALAILLRVTRAVFDPARPGILMHRLAPEPVWHGAGLRWFQRPY